MSRKVARKNKQLVYLKIFLESNSWAPPDLG